MFGVLPRSLKSYQQLVIPSPSFSPMYGQSSCDTESNEEDEIQDDEDVDYVGLHSHPLPAPRPKQSDQPESNMWQRCLLL